MQEDNATRDKGLTQKVIHLREGNGNRRKVKVEFAHSCLLLIPCIFVLFSSHSSLSLPILSILRLFFNSERDVELSRKQRADIYNSREVNKGLAATVVIDKPPSSTNTLLS